MIISLRKQAQGNRVMRWIETLARVRDKSGVIQRSPASSDEGFLDKLDLRVETLNEGEKRRRTAILLESFQLVLRSA